MTYRPTAFEVENGDGKLLRDLAQPPAPDCRTCECMWIDVELGADESTSRCDSALCVNGDQYQPAPTVVLWRTE